MCNHLTSLVVNSKLFYVGTEEDYKDSQSFFKQASRNDESHDLVSSFQDLMNPQIPNVLLNSVFLEIAVSSVHLQRVVADARAELSCHFLCHGSVDSLVGIADVEQLRSLSDNQPSQAHQYLEEIRSEAISAYLNCRYWKSDNFLPNCFRLFMYFLAAYKQKAAPPKLQLAMLILPPSKAFIAILKPSPSLPIRLAAGTRTLSRLTKAVGWLVQPILSSFLPNSTPLASPGTMKALTSLAEVLAMTMQRLLKLPPEINIFDPLITYSSPSFLAKVFIARESEPESGSVKQQLEKSCMLMSPGKNFSFCCSLPNSSMIQQHILWMERQAEVGTQPVARASKMIEASSLLSPVPLLQQMAENPISAASRKVYTGKQASFSQSMAQGLIFFLANSNA